MKMGAKSVDESPHLLIRGSRSFNPGKEGGRIAKLPCPGQDVLDRTADLPGSLRRGHGQFVPGDPEISTIRRLDHLRDNGAKGGVRRSEGDAALDLNLKHGRMALRIMGVNDDVIERAPFGRSLTLDSIY